MKKLSRSAKKFWYRKLVQAKRTLNRYAYASQFSDLLPEEQKKAFFRATENYFEAKKMLNYP